MPPSLTLTLARFRFTLTAREPMPLPAYKGAVLRGGFGVAFKRRVCSHADQAACTPCRLGNACPYGYVFETSPPEGSAVLRNLADVPTPFVFDPPLDGRTMVAPGEALAFELVLVGRGIDHLPHFVTAFDDLGEMGLGVRRARFALTSVEPENAKVVTATDIARRAASFPADALTLRFLTPTRMKHRAHFAGAPAFGAGGRPTGPAGESSAPAPQPEFHVVVRNLLRRVSSLAYFHCGELWDADFAGLIAAAERVAVARSDAVWVDERRFSTRQRQEMDLGGLVGDVTYSGDLAPFLPLLAAGEQVHAGKAAVFGNGRFVIVTPAPHP